MEVRGKEELGGEAGPYDDVPSSGRRLSPVEDLKARLSMWGESRHYQADDDDDQGSEYELLLDPNLPEEYDAKFGDFEPMPKDFDDEVAMKQTEQEEDSPYPEVRAAVHNYDQDMPCNTIRAWTIGMTMVIIGAAMNTIFSLRFPSISLSALIAQILAWPMGHGWAKVMPTTKHRTFGIEWSLNPGPFNVKEHSIIVVMASVSFTVAYATDIILAQVVFYKQDFGIIFQLLLMISSQSVGYGIAGLMRKFLGKDAPTNVDCHVLANMGKPDSISCIHDLAC
jgi:hypothetical protein